MSKASRFAISVSPIFAGVLTIFCRSENAPTDLSGSLAPPEATTPLQSQHSSKGIKRKLSETMEGPVPSISAEPLSSPPIICHMELADIDAPSESPVPVPPSPVPTEIIEEPSPPLEQAVLVEAAKAAGIKVRDFVGHPSCKARRARECWRQPLHTLILHDKYVRADAKSRPMYKLPGKMLWRLLHSGLVTQEEVECNWPPEDRAEVEAYVARPGGPYPFADPKIRKPTAAYRRRLCVELYGEPIDGDVAEDQIYMPPDEPGMDDGTSLERLAPVHSGNTSEAGESAAEVEEMVMPEETPRAKRRRVRDEDADSRSTSPSPTPARGSRSPRTPHRRGRGSPSPLRPISSTHSPIASVTRGSPRHSSRRASPSPALAPATLPTLLPPARPLQRRGLARTDTIFW